MKRMSMIFLMMFVCSLAASSQIWIEFGWDAPRCRDCEWMVRTLHMTDRQASDYHKIVHKYGQRIEKEARKDYKHWDKSYRKIYDLRMNRDRTLSRIFSPRQFGLYVRLTREQPRYIHDYRGWYDNPRYRGFQIMADWRRFEDNYWSFRWDGRDYRNYRWDDRDGDRRYDNRDNRDNDRYDNRDRRDNDRYDNRDRRDNDRYDNRYQQDIPKKYQSKPGNNRNKDKNGNNGNGNKSNGNKSNDKSNNDRDNNGNNTSNRR